MLGVDDAQLLDPVSAALVLHLAQTGSAFVVATVRSGEPCPDAIVSLWKDAGARRMELAAGCATTTWSSSSRRALAGRSSRPRCAGSTESSQGNALYVRELVLGALDVRDAARCERGLWRLSRPSGRRAGRSSSWSRAHERLAPRERAPIELLALGEPLRARRDRGAVRRRGARRGRGARALVVATLVRRTRCGSRIPSTARCVREELPDAARARAAPPARRDDPLRAPLTADDALRVARLLLDAGAADPVRAAASTPPARRTWPAIRSSAAQLAEPAVADGAGLPAALLLARAHTVRKRFADAEAVLAAVGTLAGPDDDGIDYLEQRAHALFWGLARPRTTRGAARAPR